MSHPAPARSRRPSVLAFWGLALAAGLAAYGAGQTPPGKGTPTPPPPPAKSVTDDEQEDPNPPKVRKPVRVEDEGPPPVTVPKGAFYVRIEDLARAADEAKDPAVRAALGRYVVAFDRITDANDAVTRVLPIPVYRLDKFPDRFGIFELTPGNAPRLARGMNLDRKSTRLN